MVFELFPHEEDVQLFTRLAICLTNPNKYPVLAVYHTEFETLKQIKDATLIFNSAVADKVPRIEIFDLFKTPSV